MAGIARSEGDWHAAEEYELAAALLQERLDLCSEIRGELLEKAKDHARAAELASRMYSYEVDQAVSRLASALKAEGLITDEQFRQVQKRMSAPASLQAKLSAEEQKEIDRDEAVRRRVLRAVGDRHDEALRVYNSLGGSRSETKLRDWIRKLSELGILPKELSAVLRYSDWLSKLLLPGESNKMRDPRSANK